MTRRRARTDDNHAAMVRELRQLGYSVQSLASVGGGCPDLVVGHNGRNLLVEVKDGSKPPSARRLTDAERTFHEQWRGEVIVAHTSEEVMAAMARRAA